MPHALTDRQREYLEFIKEFIQKNETSPRLEEIANHFGVSSPTSHKVLKKLMAKGFLYFGRDPISGFFIRLIERSGSAETVIEIPIAGKVDQFGELFEFPEHHGHFATLLLGANPEQVFALAIWEDIPPANILAGDLLICDYGKKPQPGDFAIFALGPKGENFILCKIHSLTMDKDMTNLEVSNEYPIPEELLDKDLEQKYHWAPIAFDGTPLEFIQNAAENGQPDLAIYNDYAVATVLRLTRNMAF
jgi:SOS-response transcriptional repressor LexA